MVLWSSKEVLSYLLKFGNQAHSWQPKVLTSPYFNFRDQPAMRSDGVCWELLFNRTRTMTPLHLTTNTYKRDQWEGWRSPLVLESIAFTERNYAYVLAHFTWAQIELFMCSTSSLKKMNLAGKKYTTTTLTSLTLNVWLPYYVNSQHWLIFVYLRSKFVFPLVKTAILHLPSLQTNNNLSYNPLVNFP